MPSPDAPGSTFACHRCGNCCTDLRERGRGRAFAEIAPGIYRQASQGGLRVFDWEAPAFRQATLAPALVLADWDAEQRLVLAHELQADTCPRFDPETTACEIYEDRPLVCRAFPLLVEPGRDGLAVAASAVCGARIPLDELDDADREAQLARAYPQAAAPALAVPAIVAWLRQLAAFLASAGALEPASGLEEREVRALEAVSLTERLVDEGIVDRGELAAKAEAIVARQPAASDP